MLNAIVFFQRKKKSGSLILAPSKLPKKAIKQPSTINVPLKETAAKPKVATPETSIKQASESKPVVETSVKTTPTSAAKAPKSSLGLGLSLKAILEEDDSKAEVITEGGNQEYATNKTLGEKEVSQEGLDAAWKKFSEQHKEEGNQTFYMALSMDEPKLDGHNILCFVKNTIQLNTFNEHKLALTTFLRNTLENKHISVKAILSTKDNGKMLYTDGEKLGALIKSNANIKFLVEKFGLETEF